MKNIFFLVIFLVISFCGNAQKNKDSEKIKSLKTAYFTEHLELTSKEAEKFWPVYNTFDKKENALYKEKWHKIKNGLNTIDDMNNAEAEGIINEYISLKEESLALKKEFITHLKKVISARKILRLKKAEYDFHKMLLKKYREEK